MIILFDLDGTLIDSTSSILEGFEVAFNTHQKTPPSDASIKSLIGYPLDVMFSKLGVKSEEIQRYIYAYKKHYRSIHTQKTTLLPQAKEAVELAASFATLGIVTTKTGKYSHELLEHFGMGNYFKTLVGREHVVHPKPHPEPILKALSNLGNKDASIYMIGDTCMDMLSAKEAKATGIGVLCGYGDEKSLKQCTPTIKSSAFEAVKFIRTFS